MAKDNNSSADGGKGDIWGAVLQAVSKVVGVVGDDSAGNKNLEAQRLAGVQQTQLFSYNKLSYAVSLNRNKSLQIIGIVVVTIIAIVLIKSFKKK